MRPAVIDSVLGGRDDDELFGRAKRVGFAGVEVTARREDLRAANGRLASLRRAKLASGLEIPSVLLGEHNDLGGIADPSADVAERAADDVRQAIVWASELGADVILVPFFAGAELVDEAGVDRAVRAFRALCPLALERGVSLSYEGTLPADRVLSLAARVGSDAFGCYFDLANPVRRGRNPASEIRQLGGLVRRVHFKDTSGRTSVRPGEGEVDFAETERALDEIGYEGWLVLETPPGLPELVARDLSFARFVLPALQRTGRWPRYGAFSYEFEAGEAERLGVTFRDLGLHAVQLGGPLLAECVEDPGRIEPTATAIEDHGLTVVALAGYKNLVAPDEATRRANLDYLSRCLEIAPSFGTAVVATETGTRALEGERRDTPQNSSEVAWRLLFEAIELLLPVAERSGSILALEGYVANVLQTRGQVSGLLQRSPSEHLQLVCDPYNYLSRSLMSAQEAATDRLLNDFEHRFVLAHLKDVGPEGALAGSLELGTGVFSQRPYLEFLRARRADLALIVEHLPLEHVPRAIERIEKLTEEGSVARADRAPALRSPTG